MTKGSIKINISLIVCFIFLFGYYYGESHSQESTGLAKVFKSGSAGYKVSKNSDSHFQRSTKSKAQQVFGTSNVLDELIAGTSSLEKTDRLINDFFTYLDHQSYVQSHNLSGGSRKQFFQICESLLADSPVTTRETDSLNYLLKNVYFFYRTLGKKRIILINDVLRNESDIVEPLMRLFYLRFTAPDSISDGRSVCPTLEQMYEYVSFFLETLGGQSYLFRRDPRIRILAQYYCVLMIDAAIEQGHNPNGIDIRPHVRHMLDEISDQKNLIYKNDYLVALEKLKRKYERS